MRKIFIQIFLILFLISCGGYRRGMESKVVDNFQGNQIVLNRHGEFIGWGRWIDEIKFPGVSLIVKLNNSVVTSESLSSLVTLPNEKINLPNRNLDGAYRITLKIKPSVDGYNFFWKNIVLNIDGKNIIPQNVSYSLSGTFYGFISEEKFKLTEVNNEYEFNISYYCNTPNPDQNLYLDLSKSLINESLPIIPIIYYEKNNFSHSFS